MPVLSLSWVFFGACALFLGLLARSIKPRRTALAPKRSSQWTVNTGHAQEWTVIDRYAYGSDRIDLGSKIQVRVQRSKDEAVLVGQVDMNAENFDDLISDLQSRAEERAASLNVYVGAV